MAKVKIEELIQDLSNIPTGQSLLEYSVNKTLENAPAALADVIRLVAVPHWFTPDIINLLSQEKQSGTLSFQQITDLAFVAIAPDGTASYHEDIRALLLKWWQRPENLTRYQTISKTLSNYFSKGYSPLELIKTMQGNPHNIRVEQAINLHAAVETVYHRLASDENNGIIQLLDLFWAFDYADEYAACHYMLETVADLISLLSEDTQLWLRYLIARNLVNENKKDQAAELFEELLSDTQGTIVEGSVLIDWGHNLVDRGRPIEAEEHYRKAFKLAEKANDIRNAARALGSLGDYENERGLYEKAAGYYERALDLDRQIGDKMQESYQLRKLGDTWLKGCYWQKAETYYRQALALSQSTGNQTQVAWAIRDLGWLTKSQFNWDEALTWYQQALSIFEELKQPANQITIWNNIGNVNRSAKRWVKAEEAYQKGLTISREIGDRVKEAWRLNSLGLLAADQEQWDEALGWYQQALSTFEELKQPAKQITIWNNIGNVNRSAKRWVKAEEAYQKGLTISREIGDRVNEAWRLNSLGLLATDQEQWDEALGWYQQALSIFEELKQPAKQISIWYNIGNVNRSAKRWVQAEEAYQKGLTISREIGDRVKEARRLNSLGLLAADQEQWDEALGWYQQALSIFEELNQPANQAKIERNCANVHLEKREFVDAEYMLEKSLVLFQKAGDFPESSETLDRKGELYQQQEKLEKSLSSYQQAVNNYEHEWDARIRLGLLLVFTNSQVEAKPLFEACLAGSPFDQLRAQLGLAIASLYNKEENITIIFANIKPLFQTAEEDHTIKRHELQALQVILDFGLGNLKAARKGLTQVMDMHWPVWDRINRRTALFALKLLAQCPYPLEGQTELRGWLDEIGGNL